MKWDLDVDFDNSFQFNLGMNKCFKIMMKEFIYHFLRLFFFSKCLHESGKIIEKNLWFNSKLMLPQILDKKWHWHNMFYHSKQPATFFFKSMLRAALTCFESRSLSSTEFTYFFERRLYISLNESFKQFLQGLFHKFLQRFFSSDFSRNSSCFFFLVFPLGIPPEF